jgi:DNA-binding NarL/FixJ family response regulator
MVQMHYARRDTERRVKRIRVLILDDHDMVADTIAMALSHQPDIEVVATAGTAADALVRAAATRPDVAVVDYQLPDRDGTATATALRDASPGTKVLMLTGSLDERLVLAAIDAGCSGFLTKGAAVGELISAVRRVHAGEPYIPASMLGTLLPRLSSGFREVGADLTAREREVLQLMAGGLTNRAIADRLVLSVNTVRNHVQNVLTKLGAHSKLEAVVIGTREGLVQPAT